MSKLEPMGKIKKMYFWASMGVLLEIGISYGLLYLIRYAFISDITTWQRLSGVFNVLANVIASIASIIVVYKATHIVDFKKLFRKAEFTVLDTIFACFVVTGIGRLVTTYMWIFAAVFETTSNKLQTHYDTNVMSNSLLISAITTLYTMLLAPVFEELLFRGIILNCSSIVNRRFAIVMSSLLFAICHGNLVQGINTFIAGLLFAYIAEKSGSLVVPMIAHIFNNSFVVIETRFIDTFVPESLQGLAGEGFLWFFVFGAIISGILLWRKYGKPSKTSGMAINNIVSSDDIMTLNKKPLELTVIPFITRISFILAIAYGVFSVIRWML